jgi:chemotaxis protein methyltransferase CheR
MDVSQDVSPAKPSKLEDIELQLLLDGIFQYYGFDFRNYARASLKRRIRRVLESEGLIQISALQNLVLHDPEAMRRMLLSITVNVTSMFRDPSFFLAFRQQVIPLLHTYPYIRLWHAGCSEGQEVYAMAILLQEAGLYDRCRIYATDSNELVLQRAKTGIYPLGLMQQYTQFYLQSGGQRSFSEYYTSAYESAIFRASLRENIVFSQHNLATDHSFNEFNIILCRNVLIYFDAVLQRRVHQLFHESLCRLGILALGRQESLRLSPYEADYEALVKPEKIFRRLI